MNNDIYDQLLGSVHRCKEYDEADYKDHYENLKDADEFCAAASLYADERTELLANSLHRYQYLIDKSSNKLGLETEFLAKGKISFNFYTDIANLFGLGTQAYTTESKIPYIGVSELSLQDIYLLQLILLHEMQHAMDFVFFDGFSMGIAERELRSRITICHSLNEIQKQFNKLYKNAYIDQAYWYIILFNSPNVDLKVKQEYYELLEKNSKRLLAEDGINFSPLILRVFGRELVREGVDLRSNLLYRINNDKGIIKLEKEENKNASPTDESSEMDQHITGDLETSDDEPLSTKLRSITGERLGDIDGNVTLIKNKMVEWHTYQDEFKNIKKQASIIITRNAESFNNIALPQDSSIGTPNIIRVEQKPFIVGDSSLSQLKNLEIPNVSMNAGLDDNTEIILPRRMYNNGLKKQKVEEEEEDEVAKNMMSNLSDMFKKRD